MAVAVEIKRVRIGAASGSFVLTREQCRWIDCHNNICSNHGRGAEGFVAIVGGGYWYRAGVREGFPKGFNSVQEEGLVFCIPSEAIQEELFRRNIPCVVVPVPPIP